MADIETGRIHLKGLNQLNWHIRSQRLFRAKRILFLLVEMGFVYALLQFVYPALTVALIRGPFSIAGAHDSMVQISTLSA
ncbi:hypothetical protein H0H93_002088 [Arthromyces matolae]|nr:hypothetical protein H0H93_002088 [Arthromyces matolae]